MRPVAASGNKNFSSLECCTTRLPLPSAALLPACLALEFLSFWLLASWLPGLGLTTSQQTDRVVLFPPCFDPCPCSDPDHLPHPSSLTPGSWACRLTWPHEPGDPCWDLQGFQDLSPSEPDR